MQILLVTPGYPPTPGGIETHVGALARGLVAAGAEVEVWTHGPTGQSRTDGVLVRRFQPSRSHRFPIAAGLFRHARRQLAGRSGLLHVHAYHATPALAALQAPARLPVVFTPHFHGVGHTRLAALLHVPYRPIGSRVFARAEQVVAVSAAEAALLRDRVPPAKLTVIRNGADVGEIQSAEPFDDQPPTILVAGRQETYKRIDAVIEAFGSVRGPAHLVITGAGPDGPRLRALAAAQPRAGDIRFLGHVPLPELRRWQRTAVGLVSMSEHEAFGLVAVEAVAGGAHAILSDIAAHREIQDFVPAGAVTLVQSRAALAVALQRAVESAKPAPGPVRSWADVVADHLALYRSLLAGPE